MIMVQLLHLVAVYSLSLQVQNNFSMHLSDRFLPRLTAETFVEYNECHVSSTVDNINGLILPSDVASIDEISR
jgi:hypothetical protein